MQSTRGMNSNLNSSRFRTPFVIRNEARNSRFGVFLQMGKTVANEAKRPCRTFQPIKPSNKSFPLSLSTAIGLIAASLPLPLVLGQKSKAGRSFGVLERACPTHTSASGTPVMALDRADRTGHLF